MHAWVGTSGYSYKEWRGGFYPEKLPPGDMLAHYAEKLPAVEINNTFYRLPRESVMLGWADAVPESFRFAVKASRRITHMKRLAGAEEETEYLLRTISVLGRKLGIVLFQLPPFLKKDLPRLEAFLASLPDAVRAAFEFRHASWRDDDVLAALERAGKALCVADADEGKLEVPRTAPYTYLRLRRPDYTDRELVGFSDRLRALGVDDAYVFFKHEDEGSGPRLAARFLELGAQA